MAMRDDHNLFQVERLLNGALVTATSSSSAQDLALYDSAEILFETNLYVAGTSFTFSLTECDTSGGTFTAVAAADVLGTMAPITGTGDDNLTQKVGYIGSKRYIKGLITVVSGSTGCNITVDFIGRKKKVNALGS